MSCETLTISGERFDFQIFKNTQTEGTDRTVGKLTQRQRADRYTASGHRHFVQLEGTYVHGLRGNRAQTVPAPHGFPDG